MLSKESALNFISKKDSATKSALGIIDDKIVNGGFVEEAFSLSNIKSELQREVVKAVSGDVTVGQLKRNLRDLVVTNESKRGVVNKRIFNQISDTYTQIERAESKQFADRIGLTAFIYFGTKINTTRNFCRARAGKVFLISEAKEWQNISFAGKPINYNPVVDLGGYNCRHTANFITNREALRRRDDLVIENRRLVKK